MRDFKDLEAELSDLKQIARGGQKDVYGAMHPNYGSVVVKMFFKTDARSQREIDISAETEFDCLPKIYETGNVTYKGAATLYVIEQRVDGEELRKRLIRGERFSLKEAVNFLEQGLTFIEQLDSKNIVHRDIKPENIIVSANGKAYFLDFGIARILGAPSLTETEALMGPHTPGYAAPEQFNNLKSDVDSRADLFSIGVVTYECLSGNNPFSKGATSNLDILQRTQTIAPMTLQLPGDTQQQFIGLLSSLMGKFPSRRPKNATQALSWLSVVKTTLYYEDAKP
jgi:serine/threonine-protein kinase